MILKTSNTVLSRKVSYKKGKAYATMSKVIMGNAGFYGCLSEPQGVSAWRKETAHTHVLILSRSLLLNRLEPQSSKAKLLLPIMPIDIVADAFLLLWHNLCRNSCMYAGEKERGHRNISIINDIGMRKVNDTWLGKKDWITSTLIKQNCKFHDIIS